MELVQISLGGGRSVAVSGPIDAQLSSTCYRSVASGMPRPAAQVVRGWQADQQHLQRRGLQQQQQQQQQQR
jgi:hypothetical protein